MRANKYGNLLTIILVILIIAIVVGLGILIFNVIKNRNNDRDRSNFPLTQTTACPSYLYTGCFQINNRPLNSYGSHMIFFH